MLRRWMQLIDLVSRPDVLQLVACVLAITHLLARYPGFYHSIMRYLCIGLLLAGNRVAGGLQFSAQALPAGVDMSTGAIIA